MATTNEPEPDPTAVGKSRLAWVSRLMWGLFAITLALWLVPAVTGWFPAWGIVLGPVTIAYAFVFWIPITAYIAASFRKVQTYETGGVMVLEQPAKEIGPGWHIIPLWFTELHTYPINPQRKQYPAEPELIFKGDDDQALPPGMAREIRATTHGPKTGAKERTVIPIVMENGRPKREPATYLHEEDNLNVQKTISITFFVIWKVRPQSFFSFYLQIPGETWEEKKRFVEEQIRDSAETDLVEQIAEHTLGEVLSDIEGINQAMRLRIQENLSSFGIEVLEARMQNPDISKKLNDALQGIAEAKAARVATVVNAQAAADATRIAAEAERKRLEEVGAGEAAQILAKETAKGQGQRAAADAMDMDPAQYRAGEVAEDTLGGESTKFVLGIDGITDRVIDAFTSTKGEKP